MYARRIRRTYTSYAGIFKGAYEIWEVSGNGVPNYFKLLCNSQAYSSGPDLLKMGIEITSSNIQAKREQAEEMGLGQ